jgi:fatty-acyl-CoA synthase
MSEISAKKPAGREARRLSREELQAFLDRRAQVSARHPPESLYTVADRWEERVNQRADNPFLYYGDTVLSYAQADEWANRIAMAAHAQGLRKGDVCGLMMDNRPPFLLVLLGMAKLGVIVSLLNTSISGKALEHALGEIGAKAVIGGEEKLSAFAGLDMSRTPPIWLWRDSENPADSSLLRVAALDFGAAVEAAAATRPPAIWRDGLKAGDMALYMFTSGTTGLPKAVRYSHMRWLNGGDMKELLCNFTEDDVFYCCLPLFHGAAIMSLMASALSTGGTAVIRRRFSAREFWRDIRRYNVTVTQYVGEICRYLMGQPASPEDRHHSLRTMMGTNMNTELWKDFQERFGVPEIYEGWGSSEGNTMVTNFENVPGAIGRVPFWEKTNLRLVRFDVESDSHVRDENGHLIVCKPGETGEAIAKINFDPKVGAGRFEGYTSAEATEKKILRDVFQPGDAWWTSGDLMREDDEGFIWFIDRIGDTFRWKSENVSTQEVADTLSAAAGVEMVNVYGVIVPGQEGRAGMAALIMRPGQAFDPDAFYTLTRARLPAYAAPLFVRLWREPVFTASGKLRKVELQSEAYAPSRFSDPLYVRDDTNRTYTPYSEAVLARLGLPKSE